MVYGLLLQGLEMKNDKFVRTNVLYENFKHVKEENMVYLSISVHSNPREKQMKTMLQK